MSTIPVYISIGSNIDPEKNIRSAVKALRERYDGLLLSSVYKSKAVGFDGDDFYNLVVRFETEEDIEKIVDFLHQIENQHNRDRNVQRFCSRTLDMDLLLFGNSIIDNSELVIPRVEINKYAFVLEPLTEIAGEERHPVSGVSYNNLWQAFDKSSQELHPVEFEW